MPPTRNTWRWKTMSKHYLMVESARFAGLKNILRRTPNHTPMHTSAGEFPTQRTLFPDTASCQGHRLISTGSRESKGWRFPQRSESQQINTCSSHAICISQLENTSKIDITIWYEYIYIYDYICILEFIAQSIHVDLMCQSVWATETKEPSATSCIWHMGSRNRRMHNAANPGSEGLSSTCMFG